MEVGFVTNMKLLLENYYPCCSGNDCENCPLDNKVYNECLWLGFKECFPCCPTGREILSAEEFVDLFLQVVSCSDYNCSGVYCQECGLRLFVDKYRVGCSKSGVLEFIEKYMENAHVDIR